MLKQRPRRKCGASEFKRTSGERALPFSTLAPFFLGTRSCGHGAELKEEGAAWREVQGVSRTQGEEECTLRAGGEEWPPFH